MFLGRRIHPNSFKLPLLLASVSAFLFLFSQIAYAQGVQAQAIARADIGNVNGGHAYVWTAEQVADDVVKGSPVGVCTGNPCLPSTSSFVETGYAIGTATGTNPNGTHYDLHQLQEYAGWGVSGQAAKNQFGLAFLNNDTWYQFQVFYSQSLSKWRVVRDGYSVWTFPSLPFTSALAPFCGAEAWTSGTTIAVQCDTMQWWRIGGHWTSYDYTYVSTSSGYCVFRPRQFGALGWGPC